MQAAGGMNILEIISIPSGSLYVYVHNTHSWTNVGRCDLYRSSVVC